MKLDTSVKLRKMIVLLYQHEICVDKICKIMNLSCPTIYRVLKNHIETTRKPVDTTLINELKKQGTTLRQISLLEQERTGRKRPLAVSTIYRHCESKSKCQDM